MVETRRLKIDFPFATDTEVDDMVNAFEACTWPYPRWTHRAQLGVAFSYLRDYPFDVALERIRYHIPLYNRTCGDPSGYHDTITVLFMRRVARCLQVNPKRPSIVVAIEELVDICDMKWPLRLYSPERLWSTEAKAIWVEPDRHPLEF